MKTDSALGTASGTIDCVKAASLILGDKWTPVLLRSIVNSGQTRFCQLQDSVGGINPRTLSARLSYLEGEGIITRACSEDTKRDCYALTEKGRALMPVLQSMAEWGAKYAAHTV